MCDHEEFVTDHISGDNICINCGLCIHDVFLDENGNTIPENTTTYSININEQHKRPYNKTFTMIRRKLDEIHNILQLNDNLCTYYDSLIENLYQNKIELRGNGCSIKNICLSIMLKTFEHYDSHINFEDVCKIFSTKIRKIYLIKNKLFDDNLKTDNCYNLTDMTKYQKGILEASDILKINIGKFPNETVYYLHNKLYAKSIKIKVAIYLYLQDKNKLKQIIKYFAVQEKQVKNCLKDL